MLAFHRMISRTCQCASLDASNKARLSVNRLQIIIIAIIHSAYKQITTRSIPYSNIISFSGYEQAIRKSFFWRQKHITLFTARIHKHKNEN